MIPRELMSYQDFKEAFDDAVQSFSAREIEEDEFRRILAKLNFNATEIDIEVQSVVDYQKDLGS